MLATFVLMLAAFVIAFAFFTFFVFAVALMLLAAFVIAFAFVTFAFFAALVFTFFVALVFWHVGFHFLHFLCHIDEFSALSFVKFFPVGESLNHSVHATYHFRAHSWFFTVMVAFMLMFVALLFLVFAAFFVFVVFLFVAA